MAEIARNPCWRCGLAGLFLLALALPARGQRVPMNFGDIEITLEGVPQGSSWHGYTEYAFRVRNKSAEQPHTVGLSVPFEKIVQDGDSLRELRRSVSVGANETVRLTLLQPDHPPLGGYNVTVFLDGQRRQRDLQLRPNEPPIRHGSRRGRYYSSATFGGSVEPLLLIGVHVGPLPTIIVGGTAGGRPAGRMPPGMGGMPGMPAPPMPGMGGAGIPPAPPPRGFRPEPARGPGNPAPEEALPALGAFADMVRAFEFGEVKKMPVKAGLPPNSHQAVKGEVVETWSGNWLAYTRYDGAIVTADEWRAMPAGVRAALGQYVETGGFLFVIGPADLRGLSAVSETKTDAGGWKSVRAGFGRCLVSPDGNYDKWSQERFDELGKTWSETLTTWLSGRRGTAEANLEFPVVEDLGIPVKGLFVLIFLFTLVIGPINIMVLARMNRRIWLLWTTPVLSLTTCLAVFAFMLISEGWEGRLRIETLTLLDEKTHRATTMGWTGVYSPLTPGDGLHFSYDTEVIPQRYYEGEGGQARSCTLDWSQDQHFASGWVEARVPSHFKVRKSETRRKRVALHHETDGSWSMVNHLGVEIRRFSYADDKGQIHVADDIAAGAPAKLKRSEKELQAQTVNAASVLSSTSWMSGMQQMAANPQRYLRPDSYLAEVDESPFLEDALRNARKVKAHALIVGFPAR
jgi:hypothetical protein